MLLDKAPELRGVGDLMALHALADALQNFSGGFRADICGDERVFKLVQNFGVDLLAAADGVLDLLQQARPGLLNAGFQAVEETGFIDHEWGTSILAAGGHRHAWPRPNGRKMA